jgi:hypothetical protein
MTLLMSAVAIIRRLLSRAFSRRRPDSPWCEDLMALTEAPVTTVRASSRWQYDRRYVKMLEHAARGNANPQRSEAWLFALLVSTCPARFGLCQTRDWANAERLARTPWQRHLVRNGAALRARINHLKNVHEQRGIRRSSACERRLRRLGSCNDRLRLIRFYAEMARRMLDLADLADTNDSFAVSPGILVRSQSNRERCGGRPPRSSTSGSPPGRRVRTVRTSRTRRGGHGGSSPTPARASADVTSAARFR